MATKKSTAPKIPGRAAGTEAEEMAEKLHAGVCQTLTSVDLLACVLERRLEAAKSDSRSDVVELRRLVQRARHELQEAIQTLRKDE